MEGIWTVGQGIQVFVAHYHALAMKNYERGSDEYWQLLAESTTGKTLEEVKAYWKECKQYNYNPTVPVGDSGTNSGATAPDGLVGDSSTDAGDKALEEWEKEWRSLVGSSTDSGANASEEWKEGWTHKQRLCVFILHHQALKFGHARDTDEYWQFFADNKIPGKTFEEVQAYWKGNEQYSYDPIIPVDPNE